MKRNITLLTIGLMIFASAATYAAHAVNPTDQFMAVCIETQEHGGQEYILTTWLDNKLSADEAGKAHELATHGHRWTIKTRQKPENSSAASTIIVAASLDSMSNMTLATANCEGNACDVVSVTWDQSVQKYLVQNRSSRRVKVELSNWATTNTIPLAPGESAYAFVTAYVHPYRAYYE